MSKVLFTLNEDGVADLMKSSEMQSILDQLGAMKAAQAGNGYSYAVHVHENRGLKWLKGTALDIYSPAPASAAIRA